MMKIFAILYMLLMVAGFICLVWRIIDTIIHRKKWDYRNPYSRKCRKCGNHQDYYEYACYPPISIGWRFMGKVSPCEQCKPHESLGKHYLDIVSEVSP